MTKAIETAEAAAEWLHARLRASWGLPDAPELSMRDRFAARYRGKRYSPGYPAWPSLDDQRAIFELLRPEEIGVNLTESMMKQQIKQLGKLYYHLLKKMVLVINTMQLVLD